MAQGKVILGMLRLWWFPLGALANVLQSPTATVRPEIHRDSTQQCGLILADQSIIPGCYELV